MSSAAAIRGARNETTLELNRDDGPLARALGAALGPAIGLPPFVLVLAGAIPLVAVLAIEGDGASDAVVGAVIGWLVLLVGISSGRPHTDRLRWAVLPMVRLGEYATLLWLGALAGGSGPAAAFTLLAVIAFRHYDLVYRPRYQGVPPPRWLGDVAGGWEGRVLAGYVLLLAGALPAGFFAIAAVFAALFVGESVFSWTRVQRAEGGVEYEDEEAEEE
jgi:uncharacterized protein DUF5941